MNRRVGLPLLLILLAAAGLPPSALAGSAEASTGTFQFGADTFAYANELAFEYILDPDTDRMVQRSRVPKLSYTLHCFAVSRTARQFFQHARFVVDEPKATHATYRYLIRLLTDRSLRGQFPAGDKIVIPGYRNLREFSADYEVLLKEASGGAWRSYVQRGNWRMIFPFSRRHQQRTAEQLARALGQGRPPVVHLVCFPSLTLNHAVLLFDVRKTRRGLEFAVYDPNDPKHPVWLQYDRQERQFSFQQTSYFPGGPVNTYEIYRGLCY